MNLNEILQKLEADIEALKNTITQAEFDEISEKYLHLKTSIIATSHALHEHFQQRLNEMEVQQKIELTNKQISKAFEEFMQAVKQLNERYQLTSTLESSLNAAKAAISAVIARLSDNYAAQYHSTFEALYHGFKAWVDAKPLDADLERIKNVVKTQIKSIQAWIRKE